MKGLATRAGSDIKEMAAILAAYPAPDKWTADMKNQAVQFAALLDTMILSVHYRATAAPRPSGLMPPPVLRFLLGYTAAITTLIIRSGEARQDPQKKL